MPVLFVILLFAVDFLLTWGVLHLALELLLAGGFISFEVTAQSTAMGAIAVKLFRLLL